MLTTKTHNAKIKKLKDEYEDQLQEQKRILNQMIQAMDVALIKYEKREWGTHKTISYLATAAEIAKRVLEAKQK
jgi:hypothetical protein